jgi:putative membrane protein
VTPSKRRRDHFPSLPRRKYVGALIAIFAVEFALLGISPVSRGTWVAENMLVLGLGGVLIFASYKNFRFSRVSYTLMFLFLVLHEIGAHYTYSLVPYDDWSRDAFGVSANQILGFERNQFDRAIHFAYGLLFAYPIREIFLRIANVRGFWGYFLPLDLTMSTSMIYELIEWAFAMIFGGDAGAAYLGTQGDVWDAHKDMALASLGAIIAMGITLAINVALQRDFAKEWAESFRVKDPEPLGEEAIAEMLEESSRRA